MADVERKVVELAGKARDSKLTTEDLTGGTFTITNGGVFGSLMSTPIINIPQSAILGMHKIQDRPMAIGGQVVVRPMMYIALSYDHRIIDGRESVSLQRKRKRTASLPSFTFISYPEIQSSNNVFTGSFPISNCSGFSSNSLTLTRKLTDSLPSMIR